MSRTVADPRLSVPLRTLKADLAPVRKLTDPGEVIDLARGNARLEPKAMAVDMVLSHSLVLRGLKTGELTFSRLWVLSDDFWTELLMAVAKKRRLTRVRLRTTIEIDEERSA